MRNTVERRLVGLPLDFVRNVFHLKQSTPLDFKIVDIENRDIVALLTERAFVRHAVVTEGAKQLSEDQCGSVLRCVVGPICRR